MKKVIILVIIIIIIIIQRMDENIRKGRREKWG